MACLIALFSLVTPRLIIILMVIFSDYIGEAYDNNVIPFLGFIFLPLTTIAYAFAEHNGGLEGIYIVLVVGAALIDLGLIGNGGHKAKYRKYFRGES